MGINQVQLGVSGHIVVSFTCVFSRSFPSAQDASRYTPGKRAGEREDDEMCLTVMRRSFLRGVRRSNVPETAAEYLIVAEFS